MYEYHRRIGTMFVYAVLTLGLLFTTAAIWLRF
jgi:hypothetical protein